MELAGDRMTVVERDGVTTFTFDDKGTGRVCGDCQLCCKLLPVPPLKKAAGRRCQHQKFGKGCAIQDHKPFACRAWSCRWLSDPATAGMSRPDRSHYVIDVVSDYVTVTEDGVATDIEAMQVWVDPAFPHAHRQPALRAYMLRVAQDHRMVTIVRYDNHRTITIFPPPLMHDGQWYENTQGVIVARNEMDRAILADFREGI
jgi:hypothetical protein